MECKVAYQTLSDVKQRSQFDRQQGMVNPCSQSCVCCQALTLARRPCVQQQVAPHCLCLEGLVTSLVHWLGDGLAGGPFWEQRICPGLQLSWCTLCALPFDPSLARQTKQLDFDWVWLACARAAA